jgi:cytochrome c-type biogenesis protein CcmH/NrfG
LLEAASLARRGLAAGGGPEALLLLGKIYRTTGEYDRALDAYDQILRKTPRNVRAQEGRRRTMAAMSRASVSPRAGN